MNILFTGIFLLSCFLLLVKSPDGFLAALLEGGKQGAVICCSLIATYSVWMGLMRVWEDSGLSTSVAKLLKPVAKKLFKTEDEETLKTISMNLSVNLLGISGAATPYGIKAAYLLDKTENAEYASALFFVLNATSIQLLPTAIIGVRMALSSADPGGIILPTFLVSSFSTLLGVLLTKIFISPSKQGRYETIPYIKKKKVGAGTR